MTRAIQVAQDQETVEVELDWSKVGSGLYRLAQAAWVCGHRRVIYTARDYVKEPLSPEAQLVRDILVLDTEELVAKWPGIADPPDLGL